MTRVVPRVLTTAPFYAEQIEGAALDLGGRGEDREGGSMAEAVSVFNKKLPVHTYKFPAPSRNFPVPLFREFDRKYL